jgi:hypothetical protein
MLHAIIDGSWPSFKSYKCGQRPETRSLSHTDPRTPLLHTRSGGADDTQRSGQSLTPIIRNLQQSGYYDDRSVGAIPDIHSWLPIVLEAGRLREEPHRESDRFLYDIAEIIDLLGTRHVRLGPWSENATEALNSLVKSRIWLCAGGTGV